MTALAIIIALGLEQWRTFRWRGGSQGLAGPLRKDARAPIQRRRGAAGRDRRRACAGARDDCRRVGYWVLDRIEPLLGLVWNVAILYLLVGFRHFSHAFGAIVEALRAGDAMTARRRLVAWRGSDVSAAAAEEIPKLAIEQGLDDSYRHVFGTLFWFVVLPGPAGAVLYRLTALLADQWRGDVTTPLGQQLNAFGQPVDACCTGSTGSPCA